MHVKDHKLSTLHSMTGGQIVTIPEMLTKPSKMSLLMWNTLQKEYNSAQLFSILSVTAPSVDYQDTQVFLVQGPPGTGKTKCIVGITSVLLADNTSDISQNASKKLLICAPSNAAVDELLHRLLRGIINRGGGSRAVNLVRLGKPTDGRYRSEIEQITVEFKVDRILKASSLWADYQKTKNLINELENNKSKSDAAGVLKNLNSERHKRALLEKEIDSFRSNAKTEVLSSAEIIATTLSGNLYKIDNKLYHFKI